MLVQSLSNTWIITHTACTGALTVMLLVICSFTSYRSTATNKGRQTFNANLFSGMNWARSHLQLHSECGKALCAL